MHVCVCVCASLSLVKRLCRTARQSLSTAACHTRRMRNVSLANVNEPQRQCTADNLGVVKV